MAVGSDWGNKGLKLSKVDKIAQRRSVLRGLCVVSLAPSLLLTGCAASKQTLDQMLADARALNAKLFARLQGLEDTGISVVEEGDSVRLVLPDVFFEFGKANLSGDARKAIAQAATLINSGEYKKHSMIIEGHTDSKGSAEYNLKLSQQRADAVEKELVFSSVATSRIAGVYGMGEARPIAANENTDGSDNPDGRAKNRRVDIVISDPRLAGN